MEVTRNVIEDLLPLYAAGEASTDSVALVEAYLKDDAELAELASKLKAGGPTQAPVPLRKEAEMEAYKEANKWMVIRTLGLALILAMVFMCTLLPAGVMIVMLFERW